MSKLIISGKAQIKGEVSVRGAKNAALPIIIGSAINPGPVTLHNVPAKLKDICTALEAIQYLGCKIQVDDDTINIRQTNISNTHLPSDISCKFRSSLLMLGLLTGKCGYAKITMPGGCNIGDRKFDLHLEGLRQLGAKVKLTDSTIEVTAKKLVGTDINFYLPTTTGTENIILAACFAEGKTRIFNANTRPEVKDFGAFLNAMGAKVTVGNRVVEVEGMSELRPCQYRIMPGWDEAITYIMGAGLTNGEICVKNFSLDQIGAEVSYLRSAGLDIFEWGGNVFATAKNKELKAFDLITGPYPGVNSDMQPLFAALASQCNGESTITDQRFTERFAYVEELKKLGTQIDNYGNCAVVRGPSKLKGNTVSALDLRCGAALALSALAAEGSTIINNRFQIERGYEDIVSRLKNLGVDIKESE